MLKTHGYYDNVAREKHPEVSLDQAGWVVRNYEWENVQQDGRIQRWAYVENLGHWVRVVLLPDKETLFNAFIDSGFEPPM